MGEQGPELVFFKSGVTASAIKDYATLQTSVQGIPAGAMLVGTHGPELMYMQGGETVMTAAETATVLHKYRTERENLARTAENRSISVNETDTQSSIGQRTENVLRNILTNQTNMQSGVALVGENGPELQLRNMDTVHTSTEIAKAISQYRTEREVLARFADSRSVSSDRAENSTATEQHTENILRRILTEQNTLNRTARHTHNLSSFERLESSFSTGETPKMAEIVYAIGDTAPKDIPAYAEGTRNAQRGAALVGENGPELVYMQGGETVLPAPETARALTAAAAEAQDITQVVTILPQAVEAMAAYRQATQRTETERIQAERMDRIIESVRNYESREVRAEEPAPAPVQIVINISGNPSPETVDRLEELVYSDAFAQRVEEVMEQAQRDTARRAYR